VPLLAVAGTLALASCGGDDEAPSPSTSTSTDAASAATITHKFGTTRPPANPERVVAVGYNDQDFALALGVVPLGFRQFQGADVADRPWARAALGGAKPEVVGETELGIEKIAALRPDLILAVYSGIAKKDYGTLSALAPTVAQSADFADYGEPWQQQLRTTGQALGREDRAAELERSVTARIEEAGEDEGVRGTSVAVGSGSADGTFYAYASTDLRARFFTDLGMRVPAEIDRRAKGTFFTQLSEERLEALDQDLLVIYGDEATLKKRPTFARLKAVREGRVIYLDEQGAISQAIGFSSPLSIPYALEKIRPRIQAAIDGDPSTPVEGTGPEAD
jgi:iron complex transport system substrate-binding protein